MASGKFYHRLRFEKRSEVSDEYGNTESAFVPQFTRSAQILPLKGGETVIAARLSGRQPVLIKVFRDSKTLTITPAWQAVDERTGAVYGLQAIADIEQRRQYLTIMAESGVAS